MSDPLHPMHRGAAAVYLVTRGVDGFTWTLWATIFSVYMIVEGRLNPLELVMLGTILECTILLMEVPTGALADTVSRKLSVVIGFALIGVGFLVMGTVRTFPMLALSQVLWGLGYTFWSGAEVAWITDEVGEADAGRLFLRGKQVENAFAVAGIAASVGLASIDLAHPLLAAGGVYIALSAFLGVVMPETAFRRSDIRVRTLHRSIASTMRDGVGMVRSKRVLLVVLAVAVVHGMSTEGFDRLLDFHLIRNIGLPALGRLDRVVWFGIISGVSFLLAIGATEFVRRRFDVSSRIGATGVLAFLDAGLILSVVAFAFTQNFTLALACIWTVSVMREVREPIFDAWLNQGLDPRSRATVNSMASQADAFGEMGAGPIVGLLGLLQSVQSALVFAGLIRVPALMLLGRARKSDDASGVLPDVVESEATAG